MNKSNQSIQKPTAEERFGSRLATERKRLGFTQAIFASKCGVNAATQFLYEKGNRTPNASYMLKAKELGADIAYLFELGPGKGINVKSLKHIFKLTDYETRDDQGRLLDLEERCNHFEELVNESLLEDHAKRQA